MVIEGILVQLILGRVRGVLHWSGWGFELKWTASSSDVEIVDRIVMRVEDIVLYHPELYDLTKYFFKYTWAPQNSLDLRNISRLSVPRTGITVQISITNVERKKKLAKKI